VTSWLDTRCVRTDELSGQKLSSEFEPMPWPTWKHDCKVGFPYALLSVTLIIVTVFSAVFMMSNKINDLRTWLALALTATFIVLCVGTFALIVAYGNGTMNFDPAFLKYPLAGSRSPRSLGSSQSCSTFSSRPLRKQVQLCRSEYGGFSALGIFNQKAGRALHTFMRRIDDSPYKADCS
jgi:hypothetical protein